MSDGLMRLRELLPTLTTASAHGTPAPGLLTSVKLALTQLPSFGGAVPSAEEAAVAREALEHVVIIAIKSGAYVEFERAVALVKPFYHASQATEAPAAAEARRLVLGLYLIHLLARNSLAEFHSEVELLSRADAAAPAIAFPIQLESYLMEGSYNKILTASRSLPHALYASFVSELVHTARDDIADCAAASYPSLSLAAAQKMMLFDSQAELVSYLKEAKPDWTITGEHIQFKTSGKSGVPDINATVLLERTLGYAIEMERIV